MSAPLKTFTRLALAAAVAPIFIVGGCDSASNQADKQAAASIRQAEAAMADSSKLDEAISTLNTAVSGNLSPAAKIRAKALLGQIQMRQARELKWGVDRLDRDAQGLAVEIAQLAGQVQQVAQMAEGYRKFDPAPTLQLLGQRGQEARGGADQQVWFQADGSKFLNLSAVAQQISKLEGQIANLEEQIRTLEDQRKALLTQSEAAAATAETAKGKDSVKAYVNASNLRKQGGDLGTQIETLKASIVPLRRDLDIANAQKEYVTSAAQQLDDQATLLTTGWGKLQESVKKQSELAKSIATSSDQPPEIQMERVNVLPGASIQAKAQRLTEIAKKADDQRAKVIALLDDATKHLGDAVAAAETMRTELRQMIDRPGALQTNVAAMKASLNANSPAQYQLDQSDAYRMLAETYDGQAAAITARMNAGALADAAMKAAGASAPAELNDATLPEKQKKALEEADAGYKSSDDLLESIVSGRSDTASEKAAIPAARTARIYGLYRWSILATDRGDLEAAKAHMDAARTQVTDAVSNNVPLAKLPGDLQALAESSRTAPPPTPEGTTQPTTEPAAEPPATQPG